MAKIKAATLALTLSLCACHKPAPEFSLKGAWTANGEQITKCGRAVPVTDERLSFVIQDAPLLNRGASSFDFEKVNVTGTVSLTLQKESAHSETVAAGILVGEIVNAKGSNRLQGYILSESQYGAWIAKNKQSPPPPDAGEVDLEITGNSAQGYSLTGDVRSSAACGAYSHLDAVAGDMTGHFGRSVPTEWSARVALRRM